MAQQHGELLKHDILRGALPQLGEKNDHLIRRSPIFRNSKHLQGLAYSALRLLQMPMRAQIPRSYLEESRALAKATGLPLGLVEQTSLQADTFVLILRYAMGKYLMRHLKRSPGLPGCTSVAALAQHTSNGSLLHARNMDYPSIGFWDQYPTVMYMDPDQGQRVIGIATAGIHTVGVTGVNESGITLSTHFHCTKRVSVFGTPIHIIGSEALRRSKTIGQFIDIISEFDRAGSWSMVVSSARENKAMVLEMVHGDLVLRDADTTGGLLANTNMYRDEKLHRDEVMLSPSVADDFHHRFNRAMDMLQMALKNGGKISPATCAAVLGDHFDMASGKVRAQGNTISVITTVTSMISQAGENKFWVASRGESPVCLGDYVEFRIDENFAEFEKLEPQILTWKSSTSIRDTEKQQAFSFFRKAYMAFHNDDSEKECRAYLDAATQLDAEEGNYWLAMGHMEMRLGNADAALTSLGRAMKCSLGKHMGQACALYTAHCYDVLNQREKALAIYKDLANDETLSPQIKAEAKRCTKKPFDIKRAHNLAFDLQFCDSLEYA